MNLEKTKAMVYRKIDAVKKNEKCMFGNDEIDIVTNYKYFCIYEGPAISFFL